MSSLSHGWAKNASTKQKGKYYIYILQNWTNVLERNFPSLSYHNSIWRQQTNQAGTC